MTMLSPCLLDTDILSAVMRKKPIVMDRAHTYLIHNHQFTFSIITKYEVLRGLFAKKASNQIEIFNRLCSKSSALPINDDIIRKAAFIYAVLYGRGELISDADILIAATAIHHGLVMVTSNESHFRRICDLKIENWNV